MTTAVLLDHVSAYAAAVRAHLSDLGPEQVEDLTDGLEADLAEALEDPRGAVATGEIALGGAALADGAGTAGPGAGSMIDLTRRFGPTAEYAAELRRAAGVQPPQHHPEPDPGPMARVIITARALSVRLDAAAAAVTARDWWPAVATLLLALRPVWWLVRGWVWFSLCMGIAMYGLQVGLSNLERFVPQTPLAWFTLAVAVMTSVLVGHGLGRRSVWTRAVTTTATLVAVLAVVPLLTGFEQEVRRHVFAARSEVVYIEVPSTTEPVIEDGVRVDGQLVSNLFVYDAAGNPLTGVQVFDDRGRPVRTTYDDGWQQWSLPGVVETWQFAAARDADGRARWNVYPLQGAPATEWSDGEDVPVLTEGAELRTPPPPFAKAPAVTTPAGSSHDRVDPEP